MKYSVKSKGFNNTAYVIIYTQLSANEKKSPFIKGMHPYPK